MVVCLVTARAAADPATAKKLTADAIAAVQAGDYKTAAETFAHAYREDPADSSAFCNIGISYFKLGEAPRAHLLLSQCVDRTELDLAFKDQARAVLGMLDEQLRAAGHTPVTIRTTPLNAIVTVRAFGPESAFPGGRTLWLPFGSHEVEIRAEGYVTETRSIRATDQRPTSVELAIQPVPRVRETPAAPPPVRRGSIWPAIATSGVTVAAGVVALLSFQKAHAAADRGNFAVDQEAADTVADEVSRWNTVFGVSTAVAIVGAGVSGYLWYRATRTQTVELTAAPTETGAAVWLRGQF